MLDPLTALGVASNVLSVIDFSGKIISGAISIYGSADGASKDYADMESVTVDLTEMSRKLSHDIKTLALTTGAAATHLSGSPPSKLKVKSGKRKRLNSGLASIKILLKSEDIARYKWTLDDIRSEMTARMVSLISEHQREMFDILRQQSEDRSRSDCMIKMSTENLESAMASAMEKLISARWTAVESAYSTTFKWVFHDNAKFPSLGEWLRSGSDIFWVTGKPGSGKSTLMKYVSGEKRTEELLQLWAGPQENVKASHFFWAAGTPMQRSLAGLLQSLLSDLLRSCPKLAEVAISKGRLDAPVHNRAPWTISELRQCFSKIKTQTQVALRVCFFVDGLDEYEGDHEEVLRIYEDLAKNTNIKLCLAICDWNIFQDWFKGRPMIHLEDLTRGDIRHFTQSKLEQDRRFAILRQENNTYDDVINLIVNEAEEVYHVQSAEILQICRAHPEAHLPLITVSFFDEEDFFFGTNLQPGGRLSYHEVEARCELTERRVRARCRDLVMFKKDEVAGECKHIQKMLAGRVRKEFSAQRYLCQATIAEAKLMPREYRQLCEFGEIAKRAFRYSDLYEKSCGSDKLRSMDWLDEMNSTLEAEGIDGPELPESDERNAFEESATLGSLITRPRLVANLSQGSVRSMRVTGLKYLESAFFLLSLGSIRGETIVDFTGNSSRIRPYVSRPLCFCILDPFADDKSWAQHQPFYQLARQFIDEFLRRTDVQKLTPSSYAAVEKFCKTIVANKVSSAGLDSFLRDADLNHAAER
ncbi:hypothetical protein IFR05_015881 [Cadophora sp. M221]|nr:hypothetical protein IFR05_015881 [Cadophora sp. M221]